MKTIEERLDAIEAWIAGFQSGMRDGLAGAPPANIWMDTERSYRAALEKGAKIP